MRAIHRLFIRVSNRDFSNVIYQDDAFSHGRKTRRKVLSEKMTSRSEMSFILVVASGLMLRRLTFSFLSHIQKIIAPSQVMRVVPIDPHRNCLVYQTRTMT